LLGLRTSGAKNIGNRAFSGSCSLRWRWLDDGFLRKPSCSLLHLPRNRKCDGPTLIVAQWLAGGGKSSKTWRIEA
jgi:hypothetical protein